MAKLDPWLSSSVPPQRPSLKNDHPMPGKLIRALSISGAELLPTIMAKTPEFRFAFLSGKEQRYEAA
jgi:hypothetical protein